jgi:AcrR family transcriptional regulator
MYDPNHLPETVATPVNREDTPLPIGSRAKSKERNRLKILDSATQLFRERGFEAATLRDIARGAGLSTGALFANFADKNEIFLTVIESENTRVVSAMREAHDDKLDLVGRLHKQLLRGYEVAQHNARLILSAFVMKWSHSATEVNDLARMSDMIRVVLLDTLKTAQARKELPQSAQLDCAALILEDLCFANMRRAFQASDETGSFDLEAMAKSVTVQVNMIVLALKAA